MISFTTRAERSSENELLPREDHTFEIVVEKDMKKVTSLHSPHTLQMPDKIDLYCLEPQ